MHFGVGMGRKMPRSWRCRLGVRISSQSQSVPAKIGLRATRPRFESGTHDLLELARVRNAVRMRRGAPVRTEERQEFRGREHHRFGVQRDERRSERVEGSVDASTSTLK
jgi:hypothetical protein